MAPSPKINSVARFVSDCSTAFTVPRSCSITPEKLMRGKEKKADSRQQRVESREQGVERKVTKSREKGTKSGENLSTETTHTSTDAQSKHAQQIRRNNMHNERIQVLGEDVASRQKKNKIELSEATQLHDLNFHKVIGPQASPRKSDRAQEYINRVPIIPLKNQRNAT